MATGRKRVRTLSYPTYQFRDLGQTLIGEIIERSEREIEGRRIGRYLFKDEDNKVWILYGSVNLDEALANADDGALLEIIYTGDEQSPTGFPMKTFQVTELER